jgi:hypothetical protein
MSLDQRWAFTALMVASAPDEPGAYALWDRGEVIYYGSAFGGTITIRTRLQDHFAGRDGACTTRASHYSWELSLDPARREAALLEEFRAGHGRLPRCNDKAA